MLQAKQMHYEMNVAHAYEMQVQVWEPNTWGVTVFPLGFFLVLLLIYRMVNMPNGIHLIKSRVDLMPNGGAT
jgi:hypothetical protein